MNTIELRQQLMQQGLHHDELLADPVKQFESWYTTAIQSKIHEPGAMSLATVDAEGGPWQRIVLLKLFDSKGFIFFSNYESSKAQQIALNARVSLLFPWHALGRQLKINGVAEKISSAESLKYYVTRPRGSQIGAWASGQSQMIDSRAILETTVESMKRKFAGRKIPLPPFWGGYRVRPANFEFWQERESRLHDRFFYEKDDIGVWVIKRLAP